MSIPIIDGQSAMPPQLRNADAATKQAYVTALSFEQTLVSELAKSFTASTGDDGSGDGGSGESAAGSWAPLLSQALSDGIAQNGGLGLASTLAKSFEQGAGGRS